MNYVKVVQKQEIQIEKGLVIDGEWVFVQHVLSKLKELEAGGNLGLRYKFHNSMSKYRTEEKYGLPCISITAPMKSQTAALVLAFKEV